MHKTAVINRTRYTLLSDRRRALFELYRLAESVRNHARFGAAATRHPGLAGMVDDHVYTTGALCGRASQASNLVLERDVTRLYCNLAALAKIWVALEDASNLEPLVAAHYEAL